VSACGFEILLRTPGDYDTAVHFTRSKGTNCANSTCWLPSDAASGRFTLKAQNKSETGMVSAAKTAVNVGKTGPAK
jgi:hypothetical protein